MLPLLATVAPVKVREAALPIATWPPAGLVSVPPIVLLVFKTSILPVELLVTGALIVAPSNGRRPAADTVTAPPLITAPPSNVTTEPVPEATIVPLVLV